MATWNEMINYLKDQENCRVDGKGFFVKDLHKFTEKMDYLISIHEPEKRSRNINCRSLKGSLTRVYEAHKQGNVSSLGTKKIDKFSIYVG